MTDARAWLQGVGHDLLTLEINTVVTASIHARKMPPIPEAIDRLEAEWALIIAELDGAKIEPSPSDHRADATSLDALAERARAIDPRADAPDAALLAQRIAHNAGELARMLVDRGGSARDPASFTATELLHVRKLWELGTDMIVAQTVVQLGGDVTSRFHPDVLESRALLDAHLRATHTAIGAWDRLVSLVVSVAEKLGALVFERGRPS